MHRRIALLAAFVLTSCASVPQPARTIIADRLFCGMSIPGGGVVSPEQISQFVDEVVEPRFPDGFTIWRARGEWRGGAEDVTILEIVHRDEPRHDQAVREIAREYRARFKQEAVLRVRTPVQMDFIIE